MSGRGEAERFLYYDGPTREPSPAVVEAVGRPPTALRFRPVEPAEMGPRNEWAHMPFAEEADADPRRLLQGIFVRQDAGLYARPRQGLFVRVEQGCIQGRVVRDGTPVIGPAEDKVVDLGSAEAVAGPGVEARLAAMLVGAGLTPAEAGGLLDAWRGPFFEAPGSRFLLLMSAADYDARCPLRVRPVPTPLARVGIVLTEF